MSTLAALVIAGAIIAAVAWGAILWSVKYGSFTALGSMTLGHGCYTYGSGYGDIGAGTQVTVRVEGETVALGSLGEGDLLSGAGEGVCRFPITVPDVPGGHDFYEVEISHRGGLTYSENDLRDGIQVTLG